MLVNCQRLVWAGGRSSDQADVANWSVVEEFTIDHTRSEDRLLLGQICADAFARGERVHTWTHRQP